jgi:hypothetical protein
MRMKIVRLRRANQFRLLGRMTWNGCRARQTIAPRPYFPAVFAGSSRPLRSK